MKIKLSKKQKNLLCRIIAGAVLLIAALLIPYDVLPHGGIIRFAAFLAAYLAAGSGVLTKAGKNILHGQVFDENFLMCIATIGAFAVGEYAEGAEVMIFYLIGELFENYAVSRSRSSISSLMDIRPDSANVIRDGGIVNVSPEQVAVGELISVSPGERVPLDGVIEKGRTMLDTSALTGESVPREADIGSEVLSGCINMSGLIELRVSREYSQSTVSRILKLVEESSSNKAKTENFITRFASFYTPAVVIGAVLLAVIPSLVTGEWSVWVYRALTFLVISCPCALVISVPLGFFGGIGAASSNGILIKGGNYLEALSRAEMIVTDKTGTLTKGTFSVTGIYPEGVSSDELLRYAAYAESYSSHPISASLRRAYGRDINVSEVTDVSEQPGGGVCAAVGGKSVIVGKRTYVSEKCGCDIPSSEGTGTVVYAALGDKENGGFRYIGSIIISDEIKDDAAQAISAIRSCGIRKTVMLTGDTKAAAQETAKKLGIDEVYPELLPDRKTEHTAELKKQCSKKGSLIYVGDGINDAPVLACADVGIAMGAMGSDAAIEAADIVIMDDKLSKIPLAIDISRNTMAIVTQNIVFSLSIKALILLFGALGITGMQAAVFADVGVAVLAICNSVRALYYGRKLQKKEMLPEVGFET